MATGVGSSGRGIRAQAPFSNSGIPKIEGTSNIAFLVPWPVAADCVRVLLTCAVCAGAVLCPRRYVPKVTPDPLSPSHFFLVDCA